MRRIGLIGDNSIEYVKTLIEIWNSGDCAVLIDWRIPHVTAIEMLKEAKVSKCYMDKRLKDRIKDEKEKYIEFILYDSSSNFCEVIPESLYDLYQSSYEADEAVILYSSGTTGKAKGIVLSQYAINVNADLISEYMITNNGSCLYIVKTLAHSSTLVGELILGLKHRIKLLIAPTICNPRNILLNINKYKVTTLCVNPTLLKLFVQSVKAKSIGLTSLETIYVSGAIVEERMIEEAKKVFSNVDIYNMYGLSEAGPRISSQRPGEVNCNGSVGKVLRNVEVIIVSESGVPLPPYKKGIIHINTPCLFTGYITDKQMRESLYFNWFNTGDIGYFDELNNLYITGRTDNMVTIGAHNVYIEEVEKVIMKIEEVENCVILPQRDEIYGSKIICYYVARNDLTDRIKEHCRSCLAYYEIPNAFKRIDQIPMTSNGKKVRNIEFYL